MKWSIAVIVILVAFALAYRLYYERVTNPGVAEEIRTNPPGERAGIVMLLTLPDGMGLPVNYLHEGNEVFAGADGRWWRAFQGEGADVSVLIRGATLMGRAKVVLDDQNYVKMSSAVCVPRRRHGCQTG